MSIAAFWRWLSAQTLRGLLLLVPLVVTVEFLVWLSQTVESSLKPAVSWVLPTTWYVPGLALVLFLCSAFILGILTRHVLMRKFIDLAEFWVTKAPVIGSIYPVVRQLTDLLADKTKNENGKVVLIDLPGAEAQVIGIITQPSDSPRADWLPADCELVYVPLSYQVGGITLIMPRARLEPLNVKPGEALQVAIMGGMIPPKPIR